MVTGANSGIGKEAALEVAKRGATVYMVCRSKERGEAALTEIKELSKNK
jgi:dehydrogenase/reductase SDR family protein 12